MTYIIFRDISSTMTYNFAVTPLTVKNGSVLINAVLSFRLNNINIQGIVKFTVPNSLLQCMLSFHRLYHISDKNLVYSFFDVMEDTFQSVHFVKL